MVKMVFEEKGTFEAYWAAEKYCRENGISCGPMCYPDPTGLVWGERFIPKWRNLSPKERRTMDGKLTGEFREGPVYLEIRDNK